MAKREIWFGIVITVFLAVPNGPRAEPVGIRAVMENAARERVEKLRGESAREEQSGSLPRAEELLRRAVNFQRGISDKGDPALADVLTALAQVRFKLGNVEDGMETVKAALGVIKDFPHTQPPPWGFDDLPFEGMLGNEFFGQSIQAHTLAAYERHYGMEHPKSLRMKQILLRLAPLRHPNLSKKTLARELAGEGPVAREFSVLRPEWITRDEAEAALAQSAGDYREQFWERYRAYEKAWAMVDDRSRPLLINAMLRLHITFFFNRWRMPLDRGEMVGHIQAREIRWRSYRMSEEGRVWLSRLNDATLFLLRHMNDLNTAALGDLMDESRLAGRLALLRLWLNPDDPRLLPTLDRLAAADHRLGRHGQAEPLFARALKIRLKTLGADHLDVARNRDHWGMQLLALGRLNEAEEQFRQAMEIRDRRLGPAHPHMADSLNNLAILALLQGQDAKAERLLNQAKLVLSLSAWRYGAGVTNRRARAVAAHGRGNDHEALKLLQEAEFLAERLGLHGGRAEMAVWAFHKSLICCGNSKYRGLSSRDRRRASMNLPAPEAYQSNPLDSTALLMASRVEHFDSRFKRVRGGTGWQDDIGHWRPATFAEKQAVALKRLEWRRATSGPNSIGVADELANLAGFYRDHGQGERAATLYEQALALAERLAPGDEILFRLRWDLGMVQLTLGRPEAADNLFAANIAMAETWLADALALPEATWLTHHRLDLLGQAWAAQALAHHLRGRKAEAATLYQRTVAVQAWLRMGARQTARTRFKEKPPPWQRNKAGTDGNTAETKGLDPLAPGNPWVVRRGDWEDPSGLFLGPDIVRQQGDEIATTGLALLMLDQGRSQDGLALLKWVWDGATGEKSRLAGFLLLEYIAWGNLEAAESMLGDVAGLDNRLHKLREKTNSDADNHEQNKREMKTIEKMLAEQPRDRQYDLLKRIREALGDPEKQKALANWARDALAKGDDLSLFKRNPSPMKTPGMQPLPDPLTLLFVSRTANEDPIPDALQPLDRDPGPQDSRNRLAAMLQDAGMTEAAHWVKNGRAEATTAPATKKKANRFGYEGELAELYYEDGKLDYTRRLYGQILAPLTEKRLTLLRDPKIAWRRQRLDEFWQNQDDVKFIRQRMGETEQVHLMGIQDQALKAAPDSRVMVGVLDQIMKMSEQNWDTGNKELAEENLLLGRLIAEFYLARYGDNLATVLVGLNHIRIRVEKHRDPPDVHPKGISQTVLFTGADKGQPAPEEWKLDANDLYLRGLYLTLFWVRLMADSPAGLPLAEVLKRIDRNMPKGIPYEVRLTLRKKEMEIRAVHQPADHPDLIDLQTRLGSSYFAMGDMKKGEELYDAALENMSKNLGSRNPDLVELSRKLARTLTGLGYAPIARKYDEAAATKAQTGKEKKE